MIQKKVKNHSVETYKIVSAGVKKLDRDAIAAISNFINTQYCADGGFAGADGHSDLYYTMFGLACSLPLNIRLPYRQIEIFLNNIDPEELDLPHLVCLVKCYSALAQIKFPTVTLITGHSNKIREYYFRRKHLSSIINVIHKFSNSRSSPYERFLQMNLAQDCGILLTDAKTIPHSLELFRKNNGGFSNLLESDTASTNATVAAIILKRQLTGLFDTAALHWLREQIAEDGGFKAFSSALSSDLLSTGTSLFALNMCSGLEIKNCTATKEYIIHCWSECGGFSALPHGLTADCEYTFYGLLASGALK
jgi:prenyltransferase beta subunit